MYALYTQLGDLEANKIFNEEDVAQIVRGGKGMMPPSAEYKDRKGSVVPAVLSEEEIMAVSIYTFDKAASSWGSLPQ
jgi:hypothetical protein